MGGGLGRKHVDVAHDTAFSFTGKTNARQRFLRRLAGEVKLKLSSYPVQESGKEPAV